MRGAVHDFPVDVETPEVTIRHVEWGGKINEPGEARQTMVVVARNMQAAARPS